MRRVAGAGLLIVVLGGGHLTDWFADRTAKAPPAAEFSAAAPPAPPTSAPRPVARAAGLPESYRIDPLRFLSSAPPDSLDLLPGIGPVLAARIVADRAARGPFTAWTELDRVRGIGPATIKRLEAAARRP